MLGRFWLLSAALFVGCGQSTNLDEQAHCATDADCAASEVCSHVKSPGARPALLPSCPYPACSTTADCSDGMLCDSPRDSWARVGSCGLVCVPPCTPPTCAPPEVCEPCGGAGEVCRSTGVCEDIECDEAGGPSCPERWHCDPAGAKSVPPDPVPASEANDLAVAHGCVRTRCDEADGSVCDAFYECAPERATDRTGCAPIPCGESKHCQDTSSICMPTSTGKRLPTTDPFGCVTRNCEEGYECLASYNGTKLGYCDAQSPLGDEWGCRIHRCDEVADVCLDGALCAPDDPRSDYIGCLSPSVSGGGSGAGGSGGVTGNAGSAQGGSTAGTGGNSAAGSSGDASGRCVARE